MKSLYIALVDLIFLFVMYNMLGFNTLLGIYILGFIVFAAKSFGRDYEYGDVLRRFRNPLSGIMESVVGLLLPLLPFTLFLIYY